LSETESVLIAKEVKNVDWGMMHLSYSFVAIRYLETLTMAWNVNTGIERHLHLFQSFEKAIEGKQVGEGKDETEKWLTKTDKYFEEVIILFKGPRGSTRPNKDYELGGSAEIVQPVASAAN
jgi:hypothetical protein